MVDDANIERPDSPPAPAPAAPHPHAPPPWWTPPKKKSFLRRTLSGAFIMAFLFSIVLNGYLLLLLAASFEPSFDKIILREGEKDQVIAVYAVEGVIDEKAAAHFAGFADEVRKDDNIKAVLLRVNSPGGGSAHPIRCTTRFNGFARRASASSCPWVESPPAAGTTSPPARTRSSPSR